MNPDLEAICKKYEYNLPSVVDQILNRYIKEILKDLSESVPTLAVKVPTKLTMKQKEKEESRRTDGRTQRQKGSNDASLRLRHYPHRPTQWYYQYLPVSQIHHRSDDACQRPQDTKDFHGLHQALSEKIADEIAAMSKKENDMW